MYRYSGLRSVAVLGTIAILGTACGSTTNQGTALAADQTIRFPTINDIGTLDPAQINAEADAELANNLFNGLLKFDDQFKIVPDLAKSYDVSSDNLTYTFHLRTDAKFSNGDPVKASDFVFSWDRAAKAQGPYGSDLSGIVGYNDVTKKGSTIVHMSGISAPDDSTFKVQLAAPAGYFLTEVAAYTLVTAVVDQKVTTKDDTNWWTKPDTFVGTGPYTMSARTPKQFVEFSAVPNWWGSPQPTVKKIHIDVVDSLVPAIAKYEQGGYDIVGYGGMSTLPPSDVLRLKAGPIKNQLIFHPKVRTTWVSLNFTKGPFKTSKDLRMAFSLALDRSKLIDVACSHATTCSAADGGLITRGLKGYLGDGKDTNAKFDPVKAKQLLQSADPTGNLTKGLTYTTNPTDLNKIVAENLQSQWQDNLNVHVDIQYIERQQFFQRAEKFEFVMSRSGWQADYDHPQDWFDNLWITGAGSGQDGYSNKTFDDLVAKADAEPVDSAIPDYNKASQMMIDDVRFIPLYYTVGQFLFKPYVQGAGTNNFQDYYWVDLKVLQH
ncbi:MAG: peptide ABC transporter substrate-binding protein [Chloroflexi bacterium]|nr:MAG: peptide ABC transporter substrate-binding protein [Chloroflexota bacterium]